MPKVVEDPNDIPAEFLECRAFRRHGETFVNDAVTTNSRGRVIEFTRHFECGRCGYETWVTYSVPSMEVKHRKPVWPDGYQVKGGLSGPAAKTLWLQSLGYELADE